MNETRKCLCCHGNRTHRRNINFGSGPACYDEEPCQACAGTGRMTATPEGLADATAAGRRNREDDA